MKKETLSYFGSDRYGHAVDITIDLTTQKQWTKNCHGDAYTSVTYAAIKIDGNQLAPVRVVKHANDPENYIIARTMCLKKLFRRYYAIPKDIRTKLWNMLGSKISFYLL